MSKNTTPQTLRRISGVVAAITFLADLITVALFIRDLLQQRIRFTASVSQVAVIVLVFVFAFLLLLYSKEQDASPDTLILIFSWLYIVFSAAIFGIISHRFIFEARYSLGEYLGYIMLIFLIAGLGYGIARFMNQRSGYFAIPYMFVVLEQIILWILLIFSQARLSFNTVILGNLFIFIVVSGFVLFFIWDDAKRY